MAFLKVSMAWGMASSVLIGRDAVGCLSEQCQRNNQLELLPTTPTTACYKNYHRFRLPHSDGNNNNDIAIGNNNNKINNNDEY